MAALSYAARLQGGGEARVALGAGPWSMNFSGEVIFAPGNQAAPGMTRTALDVSVHDRFSYQLLLSYRSAGGWIWIMTVGGVPPFKVDDIEYEMQEISLTLGYQFRL
jgi:hypothetical protein